MGLGLGAGHAEAKIEPGSYVVQRVDFGFLPTPESNAKVVGNVLYQDISGVGPKNAFTQWIVPTKNGGNASPYGVAPAGQWVTRTEFVKTRNGYTGTEYTYGGIPTGTVYLKKSTRHANQPR